MEFLGVGVVLRASPAFHKSFFSRNLILGMSMTKENRSPTVPKTNYLSAPIHAMEKNKKHAARYASPQDSTSVLARASPPPSSFFLHVTPSLCCGVPASVTATVLLYVPVGLS